MAALQLSPTCHSILCTTSSIVPLFAGINQSEDADINQAEGGGASSQWTILAELFEMLSLNCLKDSPIHSSMKNVQNYEEQYQCIITMATYYSDQDSGEARELPDEINS